MQLPSPTTEMSKRKYSALLDVENTILVFFHIKFIWQDQKQLRNGAASRASQTCVLASRRSFDYHSLLEDFKA